MYSQNIIRKTFAYKDLQTAEKGRNGYSRKSVKTSAGSVEIAVPRDRNGEFEPQIIRKTETSLTGDIEEKKIVQIIKTGIKKYLKKSSRTFNVYIGQS